MALVDIVIYGGRAIAGTGNPWFYGDVAIKDGKIASIGKINPKQYPKGIDHVLVNGAIVIDKG